MEVEDGVAEKNSQLGLIVKIEYDNESESKDQFRSIEPIKKIASNTIQSGMIIKTENDDMNIKSECEEVGNKDVSNIKIEMTIERIKTEPEEYEEKKNESDDDIPMAESHEGDTRIMKKHIRYQMSGEIDENFKSPNSQLTTIEIEYEPPSSNDKNNILHKTSSKKHSNRSEKTWNICNFTAASKVELTTHRKIHKSEKSFTCAFCPFKARKNSTVIIHARTHTGEKPFKCEFCPYKTTNSSVLKRHSRTHTGEKHYACDVCPYKAITKYSLRLHSRIHTDAKPFECESCPYKTRDKRDLNRHCRTHTGEKPFPCNICPFKATQKANLTIHLRTHTGEKPYTCGDCSYKTIDKSNLTKHLKRHGHNAMSK